MTKATSLYKNTGTPIKSARGQSSWSCSVVDHAELEPKRFSTKMCLTVRLIDLVCCVCRSEQLLWFDVVEHNAVQGIHFAILVVNENTLDRELCRNNNRSRVEHLSLEIFGTGNGHAIVRLPSLHCDVKLT